MLASIDARWVQEQLSSNLNRVLNPSVCHRALSAMKQPDATFSHVAQELAGDPYISAKVIAVANLARRQADDNAPQVCSIDRAVGLLGVRQVEALVLAVMLTGPLTSRPFLEHRPDIWRYIFGCAAAGDWLLPRLHDTGVAEETIDGESMVCGLVLGLGAQLLYAGLGAEYSRLLGPRIRPIILPQRERKQLGVDHHQVTCWALESMRCPPLLSRYPRALASQEQSAAADEARSIKLLGCRAGGFEHTRSGVMLRAVLEKLGRGADAAAADEALPRVRQRVASLAKAFKLDLAMPGEQREQWRRQTTRHAGRQMEGLVEDRARNHRPDAA